MSEKLVKQNTIEASGNQLHDTTRGFDLCSVTHIPSADHTQASEITHSAFSDTYRAFTIIGKQGSLGWNTQCHAYQRFQVASTYRPLPKTLL
jgi:hypothetical protein